jgi:hypothetical protein
MANVTGRARSLIEALVVCINAHQQGIHHTECHSAPVFRHGTPAARVNQMRCVIESAPAGNH